MLKKSLRLVAFAALLAFLSLGGTCFAADDSASDQIVCEKEYPDYGFKAHSWVAGDVAYTQIIDMKSGEVLRKMETKISTDSQ